MDEENRFCISDYAIILWDGTLLRSRATTGIRIGDVRVVEDCLVLSLTIFLVFPPGEKVDWIQHISVIFVKDHGWAKEGTQFHVKFDSKHDDTNGVCDYSQMGIVSSLETRLVDGRSLARRDGEARIFNLLLHAFKKP